MTTVNSRIFSENPIHYLNLATKEDVAIKRGNVTFRIMLDAKSENPSPSNDPFFAKAENVTNMKRNIAKAEKQIATGNYKTFSSSEEIDEYFTHLQA